MTAFLRVVDKLDAYEACDFFGKLGGGLFFLVHHKADPLAFGIPEHEIYFICTLMRGACAPALGRDVKELDAYDVIETHVVFYE